MLISTKKCVPDWYIHLSIPEKQAALEFHVRGIVRMMKGRCYKWDIINECMDDSSKPQLRPFWTEVGGEAMIQKCFEWAHEEDPDCILVLNDYNCTKETPKADAIYNLVKRLKSVGCPINEVGFQTHESITYMDDAWFISMKANMQRFKNIGITINISELDLRWEAYKGADGLQQQALCYYKLFKTALYDLSVCHEVTLWEFSSKYSWLYKSGNVNPTYTPCPWGNANEPLPAVTYLARALQEIVAANKPTPHPSPGSPPITLQWYGFGCQLLIADAGNTIKTCHRLNPWSGCQLVIEPNKNCAFTTSVNTMHPLRLTMRYGDDEETWNYEHVLVAVVSGPVHVTFKTPSCKYVQLYFEGPYPEFDYSVGRAYVVYT